jgi:hypothetical protein
MAQKDDFEIYPWKFEDDAKLSQCVVVKSVTSGQSPQGQVQGTKEGASLLVNKQQQDSLNTTKKHNYPAKAETI